MASTYDPSKIKKSIDDMLLKQFKKLGIQDRNALKKALKKSKKWGNGVTDLVGLLEK